MKILSTLVIGLSLIALSGCATTPDPEPTVPTTNVAAQPGSLYSINPATSEFAETYCPQVEAVHLTETGVNALTKDIKIAYVCGTDFTTGEEYVSQVTGGIDKLLAAYSLPNENINPAEACVAMLADPLIVWVQDAGVSTPVYAPVNSCGFPQDGAAEAYKALTLEDVVLT